MIFKYFKQFFGYFKEERKPFIIYSILSVTAAVLELMGVALVYPFILRVLSATPTNNWKASPLLIGCFIICLFLLKNLFMIVFTFIQAKFTNNFEMKIKRRVVRYLLGANYQDTSNISLAKKGKILDFLIPNTMNNFIFRLLNLNVNFFIFLLIAACLTVKFPVATVSAIIFGVLMLTIQTKIYAPYLKKLAEKISKSNLLFIQASNDALLNIKTVKISNNEKYFYDNYSEKMSAYYVNSRKNTFVNAIPPYVTEPFSILLLFILVSVISYQNYLEPDKLVASLALVGAAIFRLAPAISRIQVNLNGINSALPFVKEFMDFYEQYEIQKAKDIEKKTFSNFNDKLEIKNLNFGYKKGKQVLKDINLCIEKGKFVGISGVSGAGKTTLADIIAGLYKADSGEIFIDGLPQEKPLKIGYVPQEFTLIKGNIKDNVVFGYPVLDDAKVIEALKKAQLYEFIKQNYPEGIFANPFIDSIGFSQGQKQRLAIARALYSNPDILIFDEATSSLDLKTEDEICSVLNELKGKTTIIVIAHRLSTIKNADKIIYLENGTVSAINTFENLLKVSKGFNELVKISSLKNN